MEKMEVYEKYKKYLVPCVANYYGEPLILDRGKGKYLYDIDGKEYLDFFGGLSPSVWGIAMKRLLQKPSIK